MVGIKTIYVLSPSTRDSFGNHLEVEQLETGHRAAQFKKPSLNVHFRLGGES